MCGLARTIEEEGLTTVLISLVREQTEPMRPPRALWVPFPMGRPFGAPDDMAFQKRVLRAVLGLAERGSGPVLDDFPDDAPGTVEEAGGWVCPVSFPSPEAEDTVTERLRREMQELRTWYDLGLERRGRTTVGSSGLPIDSITDLLIRIGDGEVSDNPRDDVDLGESVRLAVEDLKAFYYEAATAQPGSHQATADEVANWFWLQTEAGKLILNCMTVCGDSDNQALREKSVVFAPPHYQRGDGNG
ncbi:MAG: hypothetical protein RIM72_21380 [Alphaproteobacteria bacterium]